MHEPENSAPLNEAEEELGASAAPLAEQGQFPDLKIYGYQILEKLSARSDGTRVTYLAKEIKSARAVVIKEWHLPAAPTQLLSQTVSRSQDYASYLPEIGQLHQLDHPNIPPYFNSFPTATGFCLVRAYQPGVSLAQLGSLPPVDIKLIADAVLQILIHLQALAPIVIHQNIKPENIIVNTDERLTVYLVDFGLHSPGSSQPIAGTPGFMPPEQLVDGKLTPSADIYSLGVTLICLLTGTTSDRAPSLFDERFVPHFRRHIPPNTPTQLVETLAKMVDPDESNRFTNAAVAQNPALELSPKKRPSEPPRPAPTSTESHRIAIVKPRKKIKWWYWGLGISGLLLALSYILSQFVFNEPAELSPEQITKNQQLIKKAAYVASDRGRLLTEKRCIGCNLSGQAFPKADLTGVQLSQSKLTGTNFANANLKLAILRDVDLSEANLTQANLQQAAIYGAKLLGTNLAGANLRDAKLIYANFKGASLQKANLTNANLQSAELSQVDLSDANLTGADLSLADLSGANLRRAIVTGANLTTTKLTGATMPDGSIHP
jgi:uncharacterized protein YjbI with pentapeptide repeats